MMRARPRVLVFNGWAAGPETWELCSFAHDWLFDYVEELDGLPDKVVAAFDDVVLVGFSMGGSMALRTFLRYPKKVRGLVLVSATARMMEDPSSGWRGMSPRRCEALRLGTRLVFRDDPSPLYRVDNMDRGLEFLRTVDLRAALAATKTDFPVRILQSERDGVVRPENAVFFRSVFPQADVTMVPGSEHVLPISVPERIDEAVARVLAVCGLRDGARTDLI